MQTRFTEAQLADPDTRASEAILRKCVHCGFCLATCPTYLELGSELDSPRGRIVLIKELLESGRTPTAPVVQHIDRCLSCLACTTTCPSGVDYMHLVDHGRAVIERQYRRPWADRWLRRLLAALLPHPGRFRLALFLGMGARPLARFLPARPRAMVELIPRPLPPPSWADRPQVFPAEGARRKRVALLAGCAQQVVAPAVNEATIRLLTRHGCEVVVARGAGCCGALVHHLGRTEDSHAAARRLIDAWTRELEEGGLDAVVANASGCGTMLKDYRFQFRDDPAYAAKAARIAGLARDVSELVSELGLAPRRRETGLAVAYHSACSLQHGQKVDRVPRELLAAAGFAVREVPDGHLCCGSAGTYNLLQPALAGALKARKAAALESTGAALVAAGNVGCMAQIASGTRLPVLHTVELLDWATGGPRPAGLER